MTGLNAALLLQTGASSELASLLRPVLDAAPVVVISNNAAFPVQLGVSRTTSFREAGLDAAPFDPTTVGGALMEAINPTGEKTLLVVDMAWGLETPAASANFDVWGPFCSDLAAKGVRVVSAYNWHMLTGDQALTALRGHQHFLGGGGLRENPFWLPNDYLSTGSLREQVSYLMGHVVPDLAGIILPPGSDDQAAIGTDPGWLPAGEMGPMVGLGTRWKIRCFGRLRIYTSASRQIDWQVQGGSPRKIKTLFAYLLTCGESGARTDLLAELLWPEDADETAKRARLHQTVAMLRKVLGGKSHIERRGDYYHLRPPPGTWIDIHSFEQLCRRAKSLERAGQDDAAFSMLQAAERLYTGDLFEDLPSEYVESEIDDWCLPQRVWLKDMALKIHRDMAAILRRRGRLRDAIRQCQRALDMDPACEIAHEEAMRIFHAQGRFDAIGRQYRQYVGALHDLGSNTHSPPLQSVFLALTSGR
jgi:DNA-binding SARP family transcriptional activator